MKKQFSENDTPILYAGNPDIAVTWKIYPANPEGIEAAKKDGYTAISVGEFSHPVGNSAPAPIIFGDLYLDFDAKKQVVDSSGNKKFIGDIETSLRAIRGFINLLVEYYNVDHKFLKIWASGGKGFHLCIPREMIGSEAGDVLLPHIYKEMVRKIILHYDIRNLDELMLQSRLHEKLFFEKFCIDISLYSGGKGHLMRLPNIQRRDRNYKVPVTFEEIMNNNYQFFVEIVKRERNIPESQGDIVKNDNLEKLFLEKKDLVSLHFRSGQSNKHTKAMELKCSFLAYCREHADEVTEPQWFILARILGHCGPLGNYLFDEYSQRDKRRYKRDETIKKLLHSSEYSIPTCKEVNEVFICEKKCGVKCPIDLFYKGEADAFKTKVFVNSDEGLFHYPDKKDMTKAIRVSSSIEIVASASDSENASWSKIVEFKDFDNKLHAVLIPYKALVGRGEEALMAVVDEGLRIEPGNQAKALLLQYLQGENPTQRGRIVDKNGWLDNTFRKYVPFDIGKQPDNTEYLIRNDGNTDSPYTQTGTIREWQDTIGTLVRGNPLVMLCVIMGFAGVMLKPMNCDGFGIHFYGLTSLGKTTTLNIGASVNGAIINKWHATVNGLENIAIIYNDSTLFLDEINSVDPDSLCYIAYMLPSGKGKIRSTKTGKNRKTLTWDELFVSTGEESIATRTNMAHKNQAKGGFEVRFINLEANGGADNGIYTKIPDGYDATTFSVYLGELCKKYRGTPFVAFLDYLKENMQVAIQSTRSFANAFIEKIDIKDMCGAARRVLNSLSLLAGVGELATEIGILPWAKGEASACVDFCFKKWLQLSNIGTPYEIQEAVSKLKELIENDFWGQIDKNGQVYSVNVKGIKCYHMANSYIDRHICKKHFHQEFIKELMRLDCLILDREGKLRNTSHLGDGKRTARGICIDAQKLLLGEDCPPRNQSLLSFDQMDFETPNFETDVF